MFQRLRALAALSVLVPPTLAACGDLNGTTAPTPLSPDSVGLHIVAGKTGTDTISTQFAQALLVELRDDRGQPMADHVIRFATQPVEVGPYSSLFGAYLSPVDRNDLRTFVSDTTDARGRARVLVTLGSRAGPALVVVTDPDHGTADTATFTVQPGAPAALSAGPADTTIAVGASFTVRATVIDRAGNKRSDAVTYAAVGSALSVSGTTVSGSAVGVGQVIATAGKVADTVSVSVPPTGVLAAFTPRGLATFNTDGSGFTALTTTLTYGTVTAWSPAGTELAFDRPYSQPFQITNLTGGVRTGPTFARYSLYPEYSRDGQWIYYTRYAYRLARVHPDGTGDTLVTMLSPSYDQSPSPSPDGTKLVYARGYYPDQLWMLDLASGQSTDLRVPGAYPAWSPSGSLIAFLATSDGNRVKVVSPDGTGVRTVGDATSDYSLQIDWSADGQWIVARNSRRNRLEIINATSGQAIPLTYSPSYLGPSWKP